MQPSRTRAHSTVRQSHILANNIFKFFHQWFLHEQWNKSKQWNLCNRRNFYLCNSMNFYLCNWGIFLFEGFFIFAINGSLFVHNQWNHCHWWNFYFHNQKIFCAQLNRAIVPIDQIQGSTSYIVTISANVKGLQSRNLAKLD